MMRTVGQLGGFQPRSACSKHPGQQRRQADGGAADERRGPSWTRCPPQSPRGAGTSVYMVAGLGLVSAVLDLNPSPPT